MKGLTSRVTIGDFTFNYTVNYVIKQSWDTFTDTAEITLPNKFLKDNKAITVGTDNVFKRGDAVEIKIGYFPNLKTKFKGFISKIIPDSPLVLECEDRMFLLKQINIKSKSFKEATVKEVVDFVTTGETVEFDTPDANIGLFEIDNKSFINAVSVFESLKKQFGFKIYYQDEILRVRALNSILKVSSTIHKMSFQNNIHPGSNLKYIKEDELDLVIKAESILESNKRIIRFGFKDAGEIIIDNDGRQGQTKSLKVYNFTEKQLDEEIIRRIDDFIYEGYRGGFTTFLEPSVEHGDKIDLTDNKNKEREGIYFIKSVETSFGINGGRQVIELKNKAA